MFWLGLLIGALGHLLYKWQDWWAKNPTRNALGYWKDYWLLIVKGVFGSFLLFSMWKAGLFPWILAITRYLWPNLPPLPELPDLPQNVEFWIAVPWGYALDSMGKNSLALLEALFKGIFQRVGALLGLKLNPNNGE